MALVKIYGRSLLELLREQEARKRRRLLEETTLRLEEVSASFGDDTDIILRQKRQIAVNK
jgi:hypothetical protein